MRKTRKRDERLFTRRAKRNGRNFDESSCHPGMSESVTGKEARANVPAIGPEHQVISNPFQSVMDLLNPVPSVTVDSDRLRRGLSFGFGGGDAKEVLRTALHEAPIAASNWDPEAFEQGLFVPELLDVCMSEGINGFRPDIDTVFLSRLLTHPPEDLAAVSFRRDILSELSGDQVLKDEFCEVYQGLCDLRAKFESEAHMYELDSNQRQIETLALIRDLFSKMATAFAKCSSGLVRIHQYAKYVCETEGYLRLADLLDYDDHLASVDLSIRIGGDGGIRKLEILRTGENKKNRFYRSPLFRFVNRIRFLFCGYRFSDREIVNRWVDSVFEGVEDHLPPLIQLMGEMEFHLFGFAFKELSESNGLSVCFPTLPPHGLSGKAKVAQHIARLFNPLLFSGAQLPVPCNINADRYETITVVTGPNSGGKTRLIQGLAIAQMFTQCGLYAPCESASLSCVSGLFVSLIDEIRADQREGRLGTELIRIRELFEQSRPGALIVLDELCSGTNPLEGEEIFRMVVSLLKDLKSRIFITTHFLQFADRLSNEVMENDPLRFLQVDLDENEKPTFQFIPGVAKTSLAHRTAARLGVTEDKLAKLVKKNCEVVE